MNKCAWHTFSVSLQKTSNYVIRYTYHNLLKDKINLPIMTINIDIRILSTPLPFPDLKHILYSESVVKMETIILYLDCLEV